MPIIPIIIKSQKECILHEGKKYCEKRDMSPNDVGYGLLGLILLACICIGYQRLLFWIEDNFTNGQNPAVFVVGWLIIALAIACLLIAI